jgi:hypothetical protein
VPVILGIIAQDRAFPTPAAIEAVTGMRLLDVKGELPVRVLAALCPALTLGIDDLGILVGAQLKDLPQTSQVWSVMVRP